jgi:hypothetical protein
VINSFYNTILEVVSAVPENARVDGDRDVVGIGVEIEFSVSGDVV